MSPFRARRALLLFAVAVLLSPGVAPAQWGPVTVGYTESLSLPVRSVVRLPGTVRSRTHAVIASEVEGLVVELAAREGERVRRGQVIARLRAQTVELHLAAARASLAEADARLELAAASLERSRELFGSGVISREQMDAAVSEADAWRGRAQQSSAQVARLEDSLERTRIRAPFSGVLVREHTQLGEWIAVGGAVAEVVDLEDLEVSVELPERYFAVVDVGTPATARFEALPGLEVEGEVAAVIPRAGEAARSFPVRVRIPNDDGRVAVGMLASVAFAVGQPRAATVVPKDAIVAQGSRRVVYVIGSNPAPVTAGAAGNGGAPASPPAHAVTAVAVEPGAGVGEWVAVDGIEDGAWVVIRGNERLAPGALVSPERVEYPRP